MSPPDFASWNRETINRWALEMWLRFIAPTVKPRSVPESERTH